MARLNCIPKFIGTFGPITIYYMFGKYYIRSRSSLTGKRVKTDPVFYKTRQYANLMAKGSPIASKVYALVPLQHRQKNLCRKITGEAMTWLKYGWAASDIIEYLTKKYAGVQLPEEVPVTVLRPSYRKSRPNASNSIQGLVKNTPFAEPTFELRAWRRRDKEFKRELYKERSGISPAQPYNIHYNTFAVA
jgi:hypothetical protein